MNLPRIYRRHLTMDLHPGGGPQSSCWDSKSYCISACIGGFSGKTSGCVSLPPSPPPTHSVCLWSWGCSFHDGCPEYIYIFGAEGTCLIHCWAILFLTGPHLKLLSDGEKEEENWFKFVIPSPILSYVFCTQLLSSNLSIRMYSTSSGCLHFGLVLMSRTYIPLLAPFLIFYAPPLSYQLPSLHFTPDSSTPLSISSSFNNIPFPLLKGMSSEI